MCIRDRAVDVKLKCTPVYYSIEFKYAVGDTAKPGLWTLDWTVDWTTD